MLKIEKYYDTLPWLGEMREQVEGLVAADRCPHALLIHGRAGTGRRHLACWITAAVLGHEPWRAGGEDGATEVGNPDLYVIEPEEGKASIGVDQVRGLIQFMALTSHGQRGRVALVWPAESMTVSAANSLLKTLEEPPGGAIVVLVSESIARLPATVVSRCQQIRVALPARDIALQWLAGEAGEQLDGLLDFGGGAPLAALALHESSFASAARQYSADLRDLEARSVGPTEVAARWQKDADLALQWLYWSLSKRVRKSLEGPTAAESAEMRPAHAQNAGFQQTIHPCLQQMTRIRELRRLLKGGINAELGIAGLLMDWYGGLGHQQR